METTPPSGVRRLLTPRFLLLAAVIAAVAIAVVVVWFQPQKLFIDKSVNEAAPGAMTEEDDAMEEDESMAKDEGKMKDDEGMKEDEGMMEDEAMMSFAGSFRSIDHETSGAVSLSKAPDGHYYVRFEDFSTENGPDLFVYLSKAPATAEGREFASDFVDLGPLKGNIGNQNYVVPDGTELDQYRSVVIWCRRFTSPFGAAPLQSQ